MDYINIQGDESTIIHELSKYMNQGGVKLMIQNLPSFMDVLDEDESFNIKKEISEQKKRAWVYNTQNKLLPQYKKDNPSVYWTSFRRSVHAGFCFFCLKYLWSYR